MPETQTTTEAVQYAPGTFSWVDCTTSDQEAAKSFYSAIFGWVAEDMPIEGSDATYSMMRLNGKDAGAISAMNDEMKSQGIPPHWNSYVLVTSADETAAKAKQLGGTLIMEPFDVMDAGRMAVITDPTGATFCIWEAKQHGGATIANTPGAFTWNELATRDIEAAKSFYTGLFDWTAETNQMGPMTYTEFKDGDAQRAGMIEIGEQFPPGMPPNWLVYFAVEDADATINTVKELGGNVAMGPMDIPVGRLAILTDPQGAAFAVIKLSNPPA